MQGLTLAELRAMSDDDLVAAFDREAKNGAVGIGFFREEMFRRDQDKQTEAMLKQTEAMLNYTRYIFGMTIIVTIATVVNVVVAFILLRS